MWKNGENVLVVNKNLNSKEIHGKKYRSPAFIMSAIFSIRRLTALQVKNARKCAVLERTAALTILILKIFVISALNLKVIRESEFMSDRNYYVLPCRP